MDFASAKNAFIKLMNTVSDEDRPKFVRWVLNCSGDGASAAYFKLRKIAEDIRTLIPNDAIFPSERIINSDEINNKDEPTIHVDSFLFEEDDVDLLVEEGKLNRNYCKNCHSFDVVPITFISHSISIQRIEYIFEYLVPDMQDKVLLDVGSRLGAVLYGAYYCSSAPKIYGVELNEDLCKLQQYIIEKYRMNDRIQIICSDIRNVSKIFQEANVIILNNVFECFMAKEDQQVTWMWLRNNITRPGTRLITVPSIEETLAKLKIRIDTENWIKKVPVTNFVAMLREADDDLIYEVCLYEVV